MLMGQDGWTGMVLLFGGQMVRHLLLPEAERYRRDNAQAQDKGYTVAEIGKCAF